MAQGAVPIGQPSVEFLTASVAALTAEVNGVVQALSSQSIRDEEDFTSQMLSAIRAGLVRVHLEGLEWTSSVLKRQTEEPLIGADFAGLLSMQLDGFEVTKGFLAQAKMAGPRRQIDTKKLKSQAEDMLTYSLASYVFLYRPSGVAVVPAVAVVAADGDPRQVQEWPLDDFFLEHFRCFIGDPKLGAADVVEQRGVIEELPVRRAISFTVHAQHDPPRLHD